jgi:hypothetical protein
MIIRISTLFSSHAANQAIINLPGAPPPSGLWRDRADYNTAHANAQHRRVEGSGAWLLSGSSKFTEWLKQDRIDAGRQSNLLYCVGKPGSGKTILAYVNIFFHLDRADDSEDLQSLKSSRVYNGIPTAMLVWHTFTLATSIPLRSAQLCLPCWSSCIFDPQPWQQKSCRWKRWKTIKIVHANCHCPDSSPFSCPYLHDSTKSTWC